MSFTHPKCALVSVCIQAIAFALPTMGQTYEPFTEEAVPRGLVYVMKSYPQNSGHSGFGCGFVDLDNDGDEDVVLLGTADNHVGVFENDGSGHFIDRSEDNGLPVLPQATSFVAGDYDGDGDQDLYFTQLAQLNVLARNEGGFQFTPVSAEAGVQGESGASETGCFGDYDGDGWLDLYVPNYNGIVPDTDDIDNKLYHNLADGTFEEVGVEQTVDDFGYGFQAVWFDYDLDGDVDLYLSNDRGHLPPLFKPNQLWQNNDGQLVNVSAGSGADLGLFSMGVGCADFDENGWPDLYCTNLAGYPDGFNPLLLNQGDGTFVESSAALGVDHWISSWSSIFFDFDNDAHLDLYVNNQFTQNSLYLGGAFPCAEVAAETNAIGNPGVSFGSAVADVDGDGDMDLLLNHLSTAPPNEVLRNVELLINHEGETRNWIRYRLVGEWPNTAAIGGRINTRVGSAWQLREVLAGGNSFRCMNELTVHVGLDDAVSADEVEVTWPGGATTRALTNLPANEVWSIYPPQRLGDANDDGIVDLDDYSVLAGCYNATIEPGCEIMDFDGNSFIDADDADAFFLLFEGPLNDCDGNAQPDLLDILEDPGADGDGSGILDICESAGDLNGDGVTGVEDLLLLLANWGPCPPEGPCTGDLDSDGSVDIIDLLALLSSWD